VSSPPAARILVVDDDEGLLILMAESLRAEGYEVATADSGRAALAWVNGHRPDLMILDLKLRDLEGPVLVKKLRGAAATVPFVVVTGQGNEKAAVDVMKQGALDYVMKDTGLLALLPTVVRQALATIEGEKELAEVRRTNRLLEQAILDASERERHNIGADLHDGLGQQLTAIELMCTLVKEDAAGQPELLQNLERMSRMLRGAVMQTRALARGLVPVGREPDALQTGLTEMVEQTNAVGAVRCSFECPQPVTMADAAAAGHLYRIAQEALNNAIKHAHARNVTIRLERSEGRVVLEISDDGAGLPKSRARRAGLGLGVMQYRANVIGAELTIASARDQGVTIRCRLPSPR